MAKPDPGVNLESGRTRAEVRARILAAAIGLLTRGGRDAVTTRAVAEAAGVQAPTLYRLFRDKDGLLDAIAEHGFTAYLEAKKFRPPGRDPVEDLRGGWDLHVEFGLSCPAVYLLMYADPRPGEKRPAAETSHRLLRGHVRRVAEAGRLRVTEELAANLVHAAACGVVLTLLAMPGEHRDMRLSEIARDAAVAAVTTAALTVEPAGFAPAAIALRARLPEAGTLSAAERSLLIEWLDRLTAVPTRPGAGQRPGGRAPVG